MAARLRAIHDEHKGALTVTKETPMPASRRAILGAGLTAVAAGVAALAASPARAQEKLAQNLVQYQETPKDGNKCSTCVNYIDPGACKIVDGKINPEGWCVAYAPKGA
jgi:hypothetical protein